MNWQEMTVSAENWKKNDFFLYKQHAIIRQTLEAWKPEIKIKKAKQN